MQYITKLDLMRVGDKKEMLSFLQMLSNRCAGIENVLRTPKRLYLGNMITTTMWVRGFPLDEAFKVVEAGEKRIHNPSERIETYKNVLLTLQKEFEDAES